MKAYLGKSKEINVFERENISQLYNTKFAEFDSVFRILNTKTVLDTKTAAAQGQTTAPVPSSNTEGGKPHHDDEIPIDEQRQWSDSIFIILSDTPSDSED